MPLLVSLMAWHVWQQTTVQTSVGPAQFSHYVANLMKLSDNFHRDDSNVTSDTKPL